MEERIEETRPLEALSLPDAAPKKAFVEPKLAFIAPALRKYGSIAEITGQSGFLGGGFGGSLGFPPEEP